MTELCNLPPTHYIDGDGYRQHCGVVYILVRPDSPSEHNPIRWRKHRGFRNYVEAEGWLDYWVAHEVMGRMGIEREHSTSIEEIGRR